MAYCFGGRRQPLTSVLDSLLILKVGHEWRSVVSRSPSQPEPRGSFSIAGGGEGRSSAGVDGRPRPRGHGVTGSGLPRSRPALSLATKIGGSLLAAGCDSSGVWILASSAAYQARSGKSRLSQSWLLPTYSWGIPEKLAGRIYGLDAP